MPRPGAWPLALAVLALVVGASSLYMLNEDFGWYLACGRAIVRSGGVPGRELFLYPIADEPIWLWHSWGWTALLAVLERVGGLPGALGLGTLAVAALLWRLFTSARLDRFGVLNACFCLLFVWVAGRRLSHKSELASWCLFAFFVCALDRRPALRWGAAVTLALVTLVWSNVHGGYLLAYATLGAFGAERLLAVWRDERGPGVRRALRLASPVPWLVLALALVLFAAPTGTILSDHLPLLVGTAPERGPQDLILEYERTFSDALPPVMKSDVRLKYVVFLGLGLVGFLCTRAPRSTYRLLVFFGMALLGHRSVRFVHGFGLASVLVTMANLGEPAAWLQRLGERLRGSAGLALHGLAAAALVAGVVLACAGLWLNRGVMEVGQSRDRLVTFDPETSCPGAAAFIEAVELEGAIFNDMLLGGDLVQRLWPGHRLFIDSRNMSYELLREYLELCNDDGAWREAEERYGLRTVVLSNLGLPGPTTTLRERLVADGRWSLAYVDPQAAVFVRAAGSPREPRVSALAVEGQAGTAPFARPERGTVGRLAERLGRHASLDPRAYLYRYVQVLGQLGLDGARREVCGAALELRPEDSWLRARRAEAAFGLARYEETIADVEWLVTRGGEGFDLASLLFLRARCYVGLGRVDEALADLGALRTIQPDHPGARQLRRELQRPSGTSTRD